MKTLTIAFTKPLCMVMALAAGSLSLYACSSADEPETVEEATPDAAVVTNDTATVVTDETLVMDADDDVAVATADD